MEFRINAEDPGRGFLPTPGAITAFDPPGGPGIRLDSGVTAGFAIPGVFDSLVAKLIVTGSTREQVIRRARRALGEFKIEGIATVLPFHRAVLEADDFTNPDGLKVHTRWIETEFAATLEAMERPTPVEDASLIRTYLEIDGKRVSVGLPAVLLAGLSTSGGVAAPASPSASAPDSGITAPVAGTVQSLKVEDGDQVAEGALLAVLEAMKMETQVVATQAGKVKLHAKQGDYVQAGEILITFET
jgi:acetyl-CoA/propionyl-CoA carboxylase, biotin carboxylase, biotin carboxyl carrier protein